MSIKSIRQKFLPSKIGMFWWWILDIYKISFPTPTSRSKANEETRDLVEGIHLTNYWE